MSDKVSNALNDLIKFNYENIYNKENPKDRLDEYRLMNKYFI
jgi:hypothetical protein